MFSLVYHEVTFKFIFRLKWPNALGEGCAIFTILCFATCRSSIIKRKAIAWSLSCQWEIIPFCNKIKLFNCNTIYEQIKIILLSIYKCGIIGSFHEVINHITGNSTVF